MGDAQQVNNLLFGKADSTADSTTIGTFLQSYTLSGTRANVSLKQKDINGTQYAVVEDVTVELVLTHTGKSQEYGGYTFTDSQYKNLRLSMTAPNGGSTYAAGTSVLLAGEYSARVEVKIGDKDPIVKPLSNISVYSQKPNVTMALAAGTPTTVTVNADAGTAASDNTFTANNSVVNNGHSAVVFVSYRPFTASENLGTYDKYNQEGVFAEEFAHYTLPKLVFSLSNAGNVCTDFTLNMGAQGLNVKFGGNGQSTDIVIGSITEGTEERDGVYEWEFGGRYYTSDCKYSYKTEKPNVIGTTTASSLIAQMNGMTYTIDLTEKLSLVEENKAVPSVEFKVDDGDFQTPAKVTSQDGLQFTYTLPSALMSADGKSTFVSKQITKDPELTTKTTGDDPDQKILEIAIDDNKNWVTQEQVEATENLFTVSVDTNSDVHKHKIVGKKKHYWKIITSQLYESKRLSQYTDNVVDVDGKTVDIKTTETVNSKKELDFWLVDGVKRQPGEVIPVTGNSIVIPCYKETEELVQKEVVTTTTVGKVRYPYRAYCLATVVESKGAGAQVEGTKKYCEYWTCGTYATGGRDAALRDPLAEPKNPGYTKVERVTTGTTRNFDNSVWERNGDPVTVSGSSTIHTVCYGSDGKTVLWEKYTDGDGNVIPNP